MKLTLEYLVVLKLIKQNSDSVIFMMNYMNIFIKFLKQILKKLKWKKIVEVYNDMHTFSVIDSTFVHYMD